MWKVWGCNEGLVVPAKAPKPQQDRRLDNDYLPLDAHMVLEKLHLPLHLNTQQAEYCIRPLSEMPTPRQVYVAVIGVFISILPLHPANNAHNLQVSAVLANAS